MADIVFQGPYRNPDIILFPGLIEDPIDPPSSVQWGEDLAFQFPDPGINCALRLSIKEDPDDAQEAWAVNQERTDAGTVEILLSGPDARAVLQPGIYFYELLQATQRQDGSNSYQPVAGGTFTILEGAGSSSIPATSPVPVLPPFPTIPPYSAGPG